MLFTHELLKLLAPQKAERRNHTSYDFKGECGFSRCGVPLTGMFRCEGKNSQHDGITAFLCSALFYWG
jgi:hypothetical protein